MALFILQPTANQTPDAGQGGSAVTGNTNTGHSGTTSSASGAASAETKTCRWFTFPAGAGAIKSVTLKVTHTSSGSLVGGTASNLFFLDYSLNNGSNWTNAVARSGFTALQGPTTFSVALSISQNLTQVQVRDDIFASSNAGGDSAEASVTISGIQIELETYDSGAVMMM